MSAFRILIIEDDIEACEKFEKEIKKQDSNFELVATTDNDNEALQYLRYKQPINGVILDIELNSSTTGNISSLEFLTTLKNMDLEIKPIIIVTTHVNSIVLYNFLHRNGVDLILYKDQPTYSAKYVLNTFLTLKNPTLLKVENTYIDDQINKDDKVSDFIYNELNNVGITANLRGRKYLFDAIFYLYKNGDTPTPNVTEYLTNKHKKSANAISSGMQTAILHGWRISPIEDLLLHYTAKINPNTGVPTPNQFIFYYLDKLKKYF